jgi:hypothetical protein
MCIVPEKDKDLLEYGGEQTLTLPHGVRVSVTLLRFKADKKKLTASLSAQSTMPSRRTIREDKLWFLDPGYFYVPYVSR